jgi:uncharacterized membrane protein
LGFDKTSFSNFIAWGLLVFANLMFMNIFVNSSDLVLGVICRMDLQFTPWNPVALILYFLWFLIVVFFTSGS